MLAFLSRDRIVASPGFNRWWMLLAALGINISIGQTLAFSVFNIPLTRVIGLTAPVAADWTLSTLGWVFTLTYVFLGLSAGVFGRWQDRAGPRASGVLAAMCFAGGFLVSALGVYWHQIWLLYVGYGVIGGCGAGIGFNTPVPTLMRWFPDRRGLATGIAVMGFGGGAILAAPMSQMLMARFASSTSTGVAETFLFLGAVYFVLMIGGALLFRLPPAGWRPEGSPAAQPESRSLTVEEAMGTRQFYLLWLVLLFNVTAGLGVLGQAAPMIQEVFGGLSASAAAAFVAILGFFNMGGRPLWASISDLIGRRATFTAFLVIGPLLFVAVPLAGRSGNLILFVACFAVIMTMYGGGFASMPPYIADIFGPAHVGAINGRVLTALSVAGVLGPVAVNYLRELQIARGIGAARAYDMTMFLMAGLLLVGLGCNLAITPISDRGSSPPPRPDGQPS